MKTEERRRTLPKSPSLEAANPAKAGVLGRSAKGAAGAAVADVLLNSSKIPHLPPNNLSDRKLWPSIFID
ncbi:MAG: hypothetical protein P4M08_12525 [Oligoflexia bacterium]|nr:hypothetical protein [Oligoflexia bacterium]